MVDFSSFTGPSSSVVGSAQFQVATDLSKLDSGLVSAERKVRTSMNGITKMMTGFGVAAAGGMAAAFGKFFNDAIKQQHAFAETFTLLPDTSEKEFSKLERQAKQLAARMNVEWKDMSQGLYNAISAGVPEDNVISFMEQAAMAATGGVATLNEAVNLGTTALNAMSAQGYETNEVFDILFSTVRKGKTTIPELASSIGFLLPVANAYKVSLEEVGAMVATLTAAGIRTRVSMTAIRAGLGELTDPAYKAGKALEEITGQSFNQLIKGGKDVGEIINILYDTVGEEQFARLFGLESRAGMLALIGEGYESYKENLDATIDSAGATELAFEKMAGTIRFQMGRAGKVLNQTFVNIAAKAIPLVENLFDDKLLPAIDKFSQWFINNEDMIGKWFEDTWKTVYPIVEDFIGGITAITKAGWAFFSFLSDNKALMIGALTAIGFAMTSAFGPAAPIIIGVGALITLIGDLKEKWDEIVEANPAGAWTEHGIALLTTMGEGMRAAAVSLYNALWGSLESLLDLLPFSDAREGPLSDLTAHGGAIIYTLADGVLDRAGELVDSLHTALTGALDFLNSSKNAWVTAGRNIVTTMANGIVSGATVIYAALSNVFSTIRNLMPFSDAKEGPLSDLTESGRSIVLTLANGIKISTSQLSDEALHALSGLEKILLGEGWMPKEGDIAEKLGQGISFTSIIERGTGLVQAIDWLGMAGESISAESEGVEDNFNRLMNLGRGVGPGLTLGGAAGDRLRNARKKKAKKEEESKLGEGGVGGDDATTLANEAEELLSSALGLPGGPGDVYEAAHAQMKESLLPKISVEEVESAYGPIIKWFKDALGGTIDLSGWALPKWLQDEEGRFAWPNFEAPLLIIKVPKMDLSGWELPAWLSDDEGYFEWPTPGDFTWPTIPPLFSTPEEIKLIVPGWMYNIETEKWFWQELPAFEWPQIVAIDWSNVTWPDWLKDDEGNFAWPDPEPFPWSEWIPSPPEWLQDDEGNFAFPSFSGTVTVPVIGELTWPTLPDWLKGEDGKFAFPSFPETITLPGVGEITWPTLPDWLQNEEGKFSFPEITWPDWSEQGTTLLGTLASGIRDGTGKITLSGALSGVFKWIVDTIFPSSDAKEGPFQNLSSYGTTIIQTLADGVISAASILTNALITTFDVAIVGMIEAILLSIGVIFDQDSNILFDAFETSPLLEGVIRLTTALWKGTEHIGKKADSQGIIDIADSIAYLNGAVIMTSSHLEGGRTPLLEAISETLDILSKYQQDEDWDAYVKLSNWSDSIFQFSADMRELKSVLEGGTTIEELSELADFFDSKYENPLFEHIPQNKSYADVFSGIVEFMETMQNFFSFDFLDFDIPDWTEHGQKLIQTLTSGVLLEKLPFSDAMTGVFNAALAIWETLPSRIQSILFGSGESTISVGGVEQILPGEAGAVGNFIEFWTTVGDKLKTDWDTYLTTDWPTQRDLIQAGIWKSLTGYGGTDERPEGTTFSEFWKALGTTLKTDWDTYLTTDWPTQRDLIQAGIWKSLTGYGGTDERPEGTTFSAFWKALGTTLKTDWDTYLTTDWPTQRDLIQAGIWKSLTGYAGTDERPEGTTFSEFWKALGTTLKTDWDTYLTTDWPTQRDLIQAGIWKSLTGYAGTDERPEGTTFSEFWKALGTTLKTETGTHT